MSVKVSYKKQFLLCVFLLFSFLIIVECIARFYEYVIADCSIMEKDVFSNVNYFLKKSICFDSNAVVHGKAPLYLLIPNQHLSTININSHGFRGPEFDVEKSKDIRVFVTGGSTAFGFGSTSDQTTIAGFLQKKFDDAKLPVNIEVINAGINGADSLRETLLIEYVLDEYKPDLIIAYTGWNDALGYDRQIIIKNEEELKFNPFKFGSYPFYRTPFVIHNFIRDNIFNYDLTIKKQNDVASVEMVVSNFKERWIKTCDLGNEKGFDVLIAVQPFLGTKKILSKDESSYNQHERNITDLEAIVETLPELNKHCKKTADLRYVFDEISAPVYYDEGHMSDLGNEIVAQNLYEMALPIILEKTTEK